ncbi:MAG: hypothetical protein FWF44_09900, partial [Defluviitaleaceae bacterium]|nr:hypothetical protein [Defluviitaleaceae bacterium]
MRIILKKSLAFALSLALMAGVLQGVAGSASAAPAPAGVSAGSAATNSANASFVSDDNGYIKYYVNQNDGSFYIMPSTQAFDQSKAASFAMFEIGGQTYRFGDGTQSAQGMTPPQKGPTGTTTTTWYVQDYAITEYLNIIQEDGTDDSWAVYVGYDIRYDGDATITSGSSVIVSGGPVDARIVLDTQFGPNDDQPVVADSDNTYITNETELSPAPSSYTMDENIAGEAPYAYGLLQDSRFTGPDSLTFAHFQSLVNGGFDYAPDASVDFTSPSNEYGAADSGAALDFSVDLTGKSGDAGTQTIGTIYGFRQLTDTAAQADGTQKTAQTDAQTAQADATQALGAGLGAAPATGAFANGSGPLNDGVDFSLLQGGAIWYGTHALPALSYKPAGVVDYNNNGNYGLIFPQPTVYGDTMSLPWITMGEETVNGVSDGLITFMSLWVQDFAHVDYMTPGSATITPYSASSFAALLNSPSYLNGFTQAELAGVHNTDVSTSYPDYGVNDTLASQKFYEPWAQNTTLYWSSNDTRDDGLGGQLHNKIDPAYTSNATYYFTGGDV